MRGIIPYQFRCGYRRIVLIYSLPRTGIGPNATTEAGETEMKKYVCPICGYVHESEELPEDFVCPLCKHGAADFEPIQ
jgi:rubredoxin